MFHPKPGKLAFWPCQPIIFHGSRFLIIQCILQLCPVQLTPPSPPCPSRISLTSGRTPWRKTTSSFRKLEAIGRGKARMIRMLPWVSRPKEMMYWRQSSVLQNTYWEMAYKLPFCSRKEHYICTFCRTAEKESLFHLLRSCSETSCFWQSFMK